MSDKPQKSYHNIGTEFVILLAGILGVALIANALLQYRVERNLALEQLTIQGQSTGRLLASISVAPLLIYDNLTVNEYAINATRQKDVVFAVFFDPQGMPITSHLDRTHPLIAEALRAGGPDDIAHVVRTLAASDNVGVLDIPVHFNDRHLADIKIGLDLGSVETAPKQHLVDQLLISLSLSILLGLAVYFSFIFKVTRPVTRLIKAVQNVAAFRFDTKVDISGNNELSELADTFNSMRHSLQHAVDEKERTLAELEHFNASLEERVHERTLELQSLNTEIAHQAMHDPLTGLPNRVLIVERLSQSILMAKRNNSRLAVFIIDLDNFKEINDTLGHPEGDNILEQVATRIPQALRESDTIGRLGGDEFAVVLPNIEVEQAKNVARKILNALEPSFELQGQPIAIGASVGIAMYPDHGEDQAVLIRRADVAMYEAKRNDKGMMIYDPEFDLYSPKRLALMADLRRAIEEDELLLYYQPQINLKTGEVSSLEALLRWKHAEQGMIMPSTFIPMAENSGLISSLSDWVLNRAMRQWTEWNDTGLAIPVAINLSVRNLLDPNLPHRISELQRRHNVPRKYIKLEITESAIMSNPSVVLNIMTHPDLSGIQYAIDDFGTGYSSLSYLKRLSVHEVKIDKAFVMDMENSDDDTSIVRSVIDLAHNLGHSVVAEGITSERALQMLIDMGCDYGQGFLFAKPAPADEIPALLKTITGDSRIKSTV